MHVGNIGSFDDDEKDVVFAINDFDEALIGDYQLDVFRLAASVSLVARERGGFSAADEAAFVDAFTESYLDVIDAYAGQTTKRRANSRRATRMDCSMTSSPQSARARAAEKGICSTRGRRSAQAFGACAVGTNCDLGSVTASVDTSIRAAIPAYRATLSGGGASLSASYFQVKSVAARLHAGVGSLGTPRYYVLIEGANLVPGRRQDPRRKGAARALRVPVRRSRGEDRASGGLGREHGRPRRHRVQSARISRRRPPGLPHLSGRKELQRARAVAV